MRFALGDVDLDSVLESNDILGVFLMVLFTFLIYLQARAFHLLSPSLTSLTFPHLR